MQSFPFSLRKINPYFYLLLITLLAAGLRLCWLGDAPNTFSTDEASNGYDAYSILLTGRDRYGDFLPWFLRAFNDSRESLYVWLIVPFIKLWGLNEFSSRFPSAIAGVLTVPVVYGLAKELWQKANIALGAALLVAVSPWSIFYSRLAFRANLFPLFFCLGLLFWLRGDRKPVCLVFSGIWFGLSLHTYAAARAFVPLFLLGLSAIYYRQLLKHLRWTLVAATIFSGFLLFLLQFWLAPEGSARVAETGLETNIFKLLLYYLSYLEPVFLFFFGDFSVRRSVTSIGIGQLYIWEIFTVVTGLLALRKQRDQVSKLIFLWLFLYPIPAALTEEQHAIRSIIGMPLFALISSYGLWLVWQRWNQTKKSLLLAAIAISLGYHLYAYTDYAINKISNTGVGHWQYGMRTALTYTENSDAQCVVVSNKFKRPNIYILFYSQYPPVLFQQSPHDPETKYFSNPTSLGKYTIAEIATYQPTRNNCLFIVEPKELETFQAIYPQASEIMNIQTPQGKSEIIIYQEQGVN